jgi:predicted nucleic acid-binding protein
MLETVTIKVDEEPKRRMELGEENWSAYLREAIRKRIKQELGFGEDKVTDDDHRHILELSIRRKMSFIDAVYVYVSKVNGVALLTADDSRVRCAEGETKVIHLSDFRKRSAAS